MIKHNGKEYARVTEVLSSFNTFPIDDPKAMENRNRKGLMGTIVHKAIEDDINEEFPMLDEDTQGYFGSYLKWKEQLGVRFLASEQRYFCDEKRITGQIDALVHPFTDFMPEVPILVDFKTSSVESKEVWPMQAHLYAYLIQSQGTVIAPYYLFIKLDKRGALPTVCRYEWDRNIDAKCMLAIDNFWANHSKTNLK